MGLLNVILTILILTNMKTLKLIDTVIAIAGPILIVAAVVCVAISRFIIHEPGVYFPLNLF